jgi:hypothetical protein
VALQADFVMRPVAVVSWCVRLAHGGPLVVRLITQW